MNGVRQFAYSTTPLVAIRLSLEGVVTSIDNINRQSLRFTRPTCVFSMSQDNIWHFQRPFTFSGAVTATFYSPIGRCQSVRKSRGVFSSLQVPFPLPFLSPARHQFGLGGCWTGTGWSLGGRVSVVLWDRPSSHLAPTPFTGDASLLSVPQPRPGP